MRSPEEISAELEKVRAAISASYSNEEYQITSGGTSRRLKRQNLDKLFAREQSLVRELAAASGTSTTVRLGVPVT